jgi:hypothetical protein
MLPPEAVCSVARLHSFTGHSGLPIVALSYPWWGPAHPDPHGAQLQRLLPVLERLLEYVASHGGPTASVGVLIECVSPGLDPSFLRPLGATLPISAA